MRISTIGTTVCCVLLFAVNSLAGPIKSDKGDKKSQSASKQVGDQEQALEQLAALAANAVGNNVAVQKQKEYHYSNVNGKEQSKTKAEEKVVNPVSGDVVLDIKQNKDAHQVEGKPKINSETDIDIPEAGFHRSFTNNEDDDRSENEVTDQSQMLSSDPDVFKFTPTAVAEYLFQTGEFEEFNEALAELVNTSAMTVEEADEYKNSVREEYNRLVQEGPAQGNNALEESVYPMLLDELESEPESYDLPVDDSYQLYGYNNKVPVPALDIEELQNEAMLREAITRKQTLNALIKDLLDEWLSRAVLTGDREAGAMLGNIMSIVSRDDDPEDFKQVRQTLTDMFADEVLRSLKPRRPSPQEYSLYDTLDLGGEQFNIVPEESEQMISEENTPISDDIPNIDDVNPGEQIVKSQKEPQAHPDNKNSNEAAQERQLPEKHDKNKKDTKAKRSVKLSEEEALKLRM